MRTNEKPKQPLLQFRLAFWLCLLSLFSSLALAKAPTKADQQSGSFVFAVIGDYGQASQSEADVANLVKGWNPDFIVTVGDNNYPIGATSTIDQNIGQYYHDYIFPYRGKYGSGSTYNRFFPVLGNHDWDANAAKAYFAYFSFYNEIGYYDFIKGGVHFFMLDSDGNEPDGNSSTSEQAKWLRKGLAASTADFNVVLHHAPYSSGKHGPSDSMQWPYKTWGADVVLAGHDHIYERLMIDGLPYFVNGVGGAELYPFGQILPGSQVRFNQDFGAMRVEASQSNMKFQFFTRTGILVDEYSIGKTIPSITSITRVSPSVSSQSSVDFLVSFSEPVTGVDITDFNLNTFNLLGAAITGVNGSGNAYTVSVNTGSGDGTLRLDLVDNDSIQNSLSSKLGDEGIGSGSYLNGEIYNIDKTAPTVTSIVRINPSPTNAPSVDYQINFSEPINGLDAADFNLISSSNATIGNIIGSGSAYTVTLNTGQGNDLLRLDLVDNDSITDVAGNKLGGNGAGNGTFINAESYTVDKSPPQVTSILPIGINPSNASEVQFIVTFSEPVNGVDTADFILSTTNVSNASVDSVNNTGAAYIIKVKTGFGSGAIRLDLIDDDSITDLVGNQLGGLGIGNGAYLNGETFTIEKSGPLVSSIARTNPNPTNASQVEWNVNFSESVFGVDASDFNLVTGTISGASITSINGSGANYTISINTGAGDGTLRLDLVDNDSIVNGNGEPLGKIGIGNGSFAKGEIYTIDRSTPGVTSIIRAGNNPSCEASVDFIVTFSESVSGVDASDFTLDSGNISDASIISVTNADPFYIVTVNTGTSSGTLRVDLSDDDSISDSAGNHPGGPGMGNGNFTAGESFEIEKSFPQVTSITRSGTNPTGAASVDFIVTFSESVKGVDTSDFKLSSTNLFNASIINVTNVDPFYIVTVNTGAGSGSLRLDLIDNDSITNSAGIFPGGTGVENGNFVNGETYIVSKSTVNFPAPSLREPRQNLLTNNPKPNFSWDKVRDAAAYEIVIATDSNFTQVISTTVIPGFSYMGDLPLIDNNYYWHVRAYNSDYQPGKFSTTNILTIDTTPPSAPLLINPKDNSTVTKMIFTWEKISSATRYQIEIDSDPDFSSPEWNSLRSDTSFRAMNLRRGIYYWHVRAKDRAGNWGAWSLAFTIKIP